MMNMSGIWMMKLEIMYATGLIMPFFTEQQGH